MLYETLMQGKMFLVLMYFGIVAGIFLTAKKLIDKTIKKSKFLTAISDMIFMLVCSALFLIAKTKFCYGEFRFFELCAFLIGIILQQYSLNNLVEKFLNMVYNVIVKLFAKLKKTKLFGKILK